MRDPLEVIGRAAMLELLAEEGSELTKAALKLARRIRKENPTPVTEKQALKNLVEEWTDCMLIAAELDLRPDGNLMARKVARWHERLAEAGMEDARESRSDIRRREEQTRRRRTGKTGKFKATEAWKRKFFGNA